MLVLLVSVVDGDPTCIEDESNRPPCVCMFNNGSKINLTSITERFAINSCFSLSLVNNVLCYTTL